MSNEFHQEIKEQVKKFRLEKIEPLLEKDDHEAVFRKEIFNELGELGFAGITIPEEFGGAGLSYTDFCVFLEELSKTSVPYAVTVSVSTMVQSILAKFGNQTQKEAYLPELTSGKEIGAFALSESGSGSDASSLRTTAKETDSSFILNGSKLWITSGGVAKTYIVMARTGQEGSKGVSAFIVRDGDSGFTYGKNESKMGWRTSPTRELLFKNCEIPKDRLIGNLNEGMKVALSALDAGRITIGAISVGLAQRALDESVSYSLTREQFKQKIFEFQGLQFMMSDMATEVEASRLLVYHAAHLLDEGRPDPKISSMAKLKASDTAMSVTTDAVQVLGGVGYTTEYPVERLMRDAKVLQIVEGTNQIQRVVIARQLRKSFN